MGFVPCLHTALHLPTRTRHQPPLCSPCLSPRQLITCSLSCAPAANSAVPVDWMHFPPRLRPAGHFLDRPGADSPWRCTPCASALGCSSCSATFGCTACTAGFSLAKLGKHWSPEIASCVPAATAG